MSNRDNKPKKSPEELVEMLRDCKGVQFNIMSEEDAVEHFRDHNNYLRTASYRKNYDKYSSGDNEGKYIRLDFAYLAELSRIDMYLRRYLLPMCIDVEHAAKVKLLSTVEMNPQEDGYSIVDEFLTENPGIKANIATKSNSMYTGELVQKYFSLSYNSDGKAYVDSVDCPIWVLTEILAFNDFCKLCKFYNDKYPKQLKLNISLLHSVRSLRNACAHNNCLLVSLRPGKEKPSVHAIKYALEIGAFKKDTCSRKLSCRPLHEITCLLVAYKTLVSSELLAHRAKELHEFANDRLIRHRDYFASNQVVSSSLEFLQKVLDNLA